MWFYFGRLPKGERETSGHINCPQQTDPPPPGLLADIVDNIFVIQNMDFWGKRVYTLPPLVGMCYFMFFIPAPTAWSVGLWCMYIYI